MWQLRVIFGFPVRVLNLHGASAAVMLLNFMSEVVSCEAKKHGSPVRCERTTASSSGAGCAGFLQGKSFSNKSSSSQKQKFVVEHEACPLLLGSAHLGTARRVLQLDLTGEELDWVVIYDYNTQTLSKNTMS